MKRMHILVLCLALILCCSCSSGSNIRPNMQNGSDADATQLPAPTDTPAITDTPATAALSPSDTAAPSEAPDTGFPTEPADIVQIYEPGSIINMDGWTESQKKSLFFSMEIDRHIFSRIDGISYPEDCALSLDELRYVRVLHMGFDGLTHIGELIVNASIADDIIDIFYQLFTYEYPIEKMLLIDCYDGDDESSMADNNTSSFNYRFINNSTVLSNHSYGLAIDINPLYNPYIRETGNGSLVLPASGGVYTDRTQNCAYFISKEDLCYNLFTEKGFTWGGDWDTVKDYQHFEKLDAK